MPIHESWVQINIESAGKVIAAFSRPDYPPYRVGSILEFTFHPATAGQRLPYQFYQVDALTFEMHTSGSTPEVAEILHVRVCPYE
jgi:hypothetical protein